MVPMLVLATMCIISCLVLCSVRQARAIICLLSCLLCWLESKSHSLKATMKRQCYKRIEEALINNLFNLQSAFYPPENDLPFSVTVEIANCDFEVKHINLPFYDGWSPAFKKCDCGDSANSTTYCWADSGSWPLNYQLSKNPTISSEGELKQHISSLLGPLIWIDYTSFLILDTVTVSHLFLYGYIYTPDVRLSLSIDELEKMPSSSDVEWALEIILSWAKFYARSYGGTMTGLKTDSDKMIVRNYYNYYDNNIIVNVVDIRIIMAILLNIFIGVIGVYGLPVALNILISKSKEKAIIFDIDHVNHLYWATALVCGIVNSGIKGYDLTLSYIFIDNYTAAWATKTFICIVFFVLELVSVYLVLALTNSVVRVSNRRCHCMRLVHTFAICHILWFLHLVGCNLLVAIFFIALAPAQTLAALTLIYLVILSTILYTALNIHLLCKMRRCSTRCCQLKCILFVAFMIYGSVVGFMVFFTLTFNDLARNGLTSSGLGSVVLSLVAPTIVFMITLKLKQKLWGFFMPPTQEAATAVTLNEEGISTEHATQQIPDENTPLILIQNKY